MTQNSNAFAAGCAPAAEAMRIAPANGIAAEADGSGAVDDALRRSLAWLSREQHPEGFWVGMVESNSCIEAEWLIATHHILKSPLPFEADVVRALFQRQRPDGSWDVYPGAPDGDLNGTVEVYTALRVLGHDPQRAELTRARGWILEHGGLRGVRAFTRYWLAMLGVWPWERTPNLPPEIIRFPLWFPFSIYNFAQWARATMVPLAVLSARRPVWPLPGGDRLDELFPDGYAAFDFSPGSKRASPLSWTSFFQTVDRVLHAVQSAVPIPRREATIRLCLEWMIRHQDADGSWGGIQPPWIYGLIALRNEGFALDHPVLEKGLSALSGSWSYERDGARHIQATDSAVWDTFFSVLAYHEAGVDVTESAEMERGLRWILDKQVLVPGDWSLRAPGVEPGGWPFERANNFYPDADDTAVALIVLARLRGQAPNLRARIDAAIERGVGWLLALQSTNGGWAAFDKDNDKAIISSIPFCNFGEALDPPSVDVTGHVLEAFGLLGMDRDHPAIRRALAYVRSEQEADGSWFGRWGVNYIYGVGAVLPGLEAVGEEMSAEYVQRSVRWLLSRQNADGGWGESCASYMDDEMRGRGPSTPSQTAWAMLALISARSAELRPAIQRGAQYLCRSQTAEGSWDERVYTAAGFPGYGVGMRLNLREAQLRERLQQGPELSRGFMISFTMYRHYFPAIALARVKRAAPS